MDPFAASLGRSPELFPHSFNLHPESVTLIRLCENDYRAASFLDGRILTHRTAARTVPWGQLQSAILESQLQESCDFIFHIGHVGSTLLSRLLGNHQQIFALREPAVLRTLAQVMVGPKGRWSAADFEARLSAFLKLWSRTFHASQRSCIKATSFVSELAQQILARPANPKALLVFVPAETYLATILGGPNSRQEARMLAQSRLRRLEHRIGGRPWDLSRLGEGETIALSWACEMTALSAAAAQIPSRVLWWNFDQFFEDSATCLASAFGHFGIEITERDARDILAGPDMRRYSKAPEYAYGASLRQDVLNQARIEFAAEIARGLRWLEHAATEFSSIAKVMA